MPEELPKDQLQHVTTLSQDLKDTLQASRTSVDKIDELLKKIAYYSATDLDKDNIPLAENVVEIEESENDKEIDETETIKNENLQLLLDIQREEYLERKWNGLLKQNEEILDSLVDWVKLNDHSLKFKRDEKNYLARIQSSIDILNDDDKENREHIRSLANLIQELINILEDSLKNKDKVANAKEEIVKEINNLQEIYHSNKLN